MTAASGGEVQADNTDARVRKIQEATFLIVRDLGKETHGSRAAMQAYMKVEAREELERENHRALPCVGIHDGNDRAAMA